MRILATIIKKLLIVIISLIRPLLGPATCRFPDGCTRYAIRELQEKPLFIALWSITKRLLLCSPFYGVLKK